MISRQMKNSHVFWEIETYGLRNAGHTFLFPEKNRWIDGWMDLGLVTNGFYLFSGPNCMGPADNNGCVRDSKGYICIQ